MLCFLQGIKKLWKESSNVRVEEEAWEKLRIIASINKRSINKEIEYLIDQRIREYEEKDGEIEIENDKK